MKTVMEQQYEKLIINHACCLDASTANRVSILQDFHDNSRDYYENLCDILYAISTGALHAPLWMTQSGHFYTSTHQIRKSDIYIVDSAEIPTFEGDLLEQLELVFMRVYRYSGKELKILEKNPTAL